jgi:hypothetical protein
MMDWKLEGSGEAHTARINRISNAQNLRVEDGIKFVVCDEVDLGEAEVWSEQFTAMDVKAQIWVGAAFERIEPKEVVAYMLEHKLPWRLNFQSHQYIWAVNERGR